MAGDWIKMRVSLATDPAVIGMATSLDRSEFEVVGMLHHLWGWADAHSRDGHADGVTDRWVNRFVQCDGFADAMAHVGWLQVTGTGILFPHFDRHNGESAKARGLAAERKRKQRSAVTGQTGQASRSERDNSVTREEKNREEKNKSSTPLPPEGEDAADAAEEQVDQENAVPVRASQANEKPEQSEGFELFWKAYPRKVAKADAAKAWKKLKPDGAMITTIMEALAKYCLSHEWVKDGGQFVPHPATWLNGRRWEDEVRPASNVQPIQPSRFVNLPAVNGNEIRDKTAENERLGVRRANF